MCGEKIASRQTAFKNNFERNSESNWRYKFRRQVLIKKLSIAYNNMAANNDGYTRFRRKNSLRAFNEKTDEKRSLQARSRADGFQRR